MQVNKEISSNELTFSDVVILIRNTLVEIKNNWKVMCVFVTLSMLGMVYNYLTTPKKYTATLTFMVNENEGGGGLAGAASILSSLGVPGQMEDNLDKILALSKSVRISEGALFAKENVDGETDYLANHIIKKYNFYANEWKSSKDLNGFLFRRSVIDSFTEKERKALKSVYSKIIGNEKEEGLMSNSQSRLTSIMTIKVTTISDELSVKLANQLFRNLGDFYIEKTVQREAETYRVVKRKVDSLKNLLIGADYASAKFEDSNRGLLMETIKVPTKQLSRDVARLTIMYGEAVKNLELSDFALKNKRPYIQVIDTPFTPNPPIVKSLKKTIVIGFALGLFLGTVWIIFSRLIIDSLRKVEN